jgi:hypothetical protein
LHCAASFLTVLTSEFCINQRFCPVTRRTGPGWTSQTKSAGKPALDDGVFKPGSGGKSNGFRANQRIRGKMLA